MNKLKYIVGWLAKAFAMLLPLGFGMMIICLFITQTLPTEITLFIFFTVGTILSMLYKIEAGINKR